MSVCMHEKAQRHFEKAEKVFSDVVDCCGEGLSSVERVLGGTTAIADVDGEDKNRTNGLKEGQRRRKSGRWLQRGAWIYSDER